ncbi:MAG: polysaccharide biosynthesis tyrosine autokinase [Candidatus Omnitrophica bacterium]|nr:polysaccharide biosynthesis tyrosine autokinase [Candidatus Omnitrophota bacterium]
MIRGENLEKEIEYTLRDYWEIFYRRRIVLVISSAAILLVSVLYVLFLMQLKYKATAVVVVGSPNIQVKTVEEGAVKEEYEAKNELELMQSNIIANRVISLLNESEAYKRDISQDDIIRMLRFDLKIRSNIIEISATSPDPQEAFLVVKFLIDAYIQETNEHRKKIIKDAYDSLSSQLSAKRVELEAAERKLTKFVLDNEIIAKGIEVGKVTEEGKEETTTGESDINNKYLQLKSQRINLEAFLEEVKSHRQKDQITALSIISKKEEGLVDLTLRDQLYEKERALSKLLLTQSEVHPDAIEAQGEVEEAKKKIDVELDRAIESLEIAVAHLKREEEKLRSLIKEGLSEKMVEYSGLLRDVDVKKSIYNSFISQLQQLDVVEKVERVPALKVLKAPELPTKPLHGKLFGLLIGFIISIVGGIAAAFVVESIDISVRSIEDVEDILGLSVLTSIPLYKGYIPAEQSAEAVDERRAKCELGLITVRHPQSIISESFKHLRVNIEFLQAGKNIKTIVVTSPAPQEGKSSVSINLAMAMAKAGKNVILIDCDLRRPTLHRYFNLDNSKGLTNFLVDNGPPETVTINDTEEEKLRLITSGPIPPNPNELLGSDRLEKIITYLKAKCDTVILDAPPVLAVSDSLILASKTDAVILVFFANKTAKRAASRTALLVNNVKGNILGVVLNGVETAPGSYYYKYDYYAEKK